MTLDNELIVDNFAGGGGASCGIEMALKRPVNIAVNHDPEAVGMHLMNHPLTDHHCENVWDIRPADVCKGRPVALAWFSPDCKHFSKAKGGKPVEKKIRGLAWIVLRWAATVRPRVICLENVEEFTSWGPLLPDGKPDPAKKGVEFRSFVNALKHHGYVVDWRELKACDYGVPTIRKRLFLVARCDGRPIIWPKPTHGPAGSGLLPYRTAAECIDWSIPCPSIFERERPLVENTLIRIAKGIQRFVIDNPNPFIVNLTHGGRLEPLDEPLRTITCAKRGEKALVTPTLIQTGYGERKGQQPRALDIEKPLGTVVAGGVKHALVTPTIVGVGGRAGQSRPRSGDEPLATITSKGDAAVVAAFLAQHNNHQGAIPSTGRPIDEPISTITARGTQQNIVVSHMMKMRGDNVGSRMDEPLHTISAGGTHHAQVNAFLIKYFGASVAQDMRDPLGTLTTKDKFGLVTIHGEEYQIVDIGMRMLTPRELYRAQGFPDSYIIDRAMMAEQNIDGVWIVEEKPLNKTAQVRMCGNSVCPPLAKAVIEANVSQAIAFDRIAM